MAHQAFLVYLKMFSLPQAHHWWSEKPRIVFGWRLQAKQEWVRSSFWCSCDFNSRAVLMLKVVPDPSPLLTYPRTSALGNKILIFQCKCRRNTVNFICHVFSSTKELGFVSLNLDGRTNQSLENQAGEMPRWWRACFALAENTGLVPSIHMSAHNICNSSPENLMPSPASMSTMYLCSTHTDKCRQNAQESKNNFSRSETQWCHIMPITTVWK